MGQEARADDQHALLAQRAQPLAELHQAVRVVGGQRHLQHRDVGLGVHDLQRHPRAVVEPARDVLVDGLAARASSPRRAGPAPWRRASRRSSGSTSARTRRSRRPAARGSRVRLTGADSQCALTMRIAFGRGRSLRPRRELAGPDRVVEQRRRTVADVQGRHGSGHDILNSCWFNYIPWVVHRQEVAEGRSGGPFPAGLPRRGRRRTPAGSSRPAPRPAPRAAG